MKRKIANCLKLGILLIGVSLLLWNCEREEAIFELPISNFQEKTVLQRITLDELTSDRNFTKIAKEFEIHNRLLGKEKNFRGKNNENFVIDTKSIIKVEKQNYFSYTFFIERKEPTKNSIENLVIEKMNDSVRGFFIKYKFSDNYINESLKKNSIPFEGKIQRSVYKKNISELLNSLVKGKNHLAKMQECFPTYIVIDVKCASGKHVVGQTCDYAGTSDAAYQYTVSRDMCFPSGDGWSDDTYVDNDNTGGGGYGGSNNSTTSINYKCGDEYHGCVKKADKISNSLELSDIQRDWLRGQSEELIEGLEFVLIEENYSPGSENFISKAIEVLMKNGDVDLENRLIYDSTLDQDYRNKMSTKERQIFDGMSQFQKSQYLISAQQAWNYAEAYYKDSFYNGKGDAVRHSFWNALSTVRIGDTLTKSLTDAHEDKPASYNYSYKENQMDLYNNSIGINLAKLSGRLYKLVDNAILNGELRYLSHLLGGGNSGRATDLSMLIPTNQ